MDWLTFVLTLGIGLLGWLAGLAVSTFLQDREHYRKQRALLAALGVEVRRIRAELGGTDEHWIPVAVMGRSAAIPQIHPWIQPLVVSIAESDPSLLAKFMELERFLSNQSLSVADLQDAKAALTEANQELAERERVVESEGNIAGIGDKMSLYAHARLAVQSATDRVRFAQDVVDSNHKRIRTALRIIEERVSQLDAVLKDHPALDFRRLFGVPIRLLADEPGTKPLPPLPPASGMSNRGHS